MFCLAGLGNRSASVPAGFGLTALAQMFKFLPD
jgi:hypothetical protein